MSEPVVLLHAGVCDHRMWEGIAPALREAGRKVIAPDLRGFGTRPPGLSPFSHSGDVLALLDGIGAERAHLVGASFGGLVALEVAALAPDRVSSLALLAPLLIEWEFSQGFEAYVRSEAQALARGDVDAAVDANVHYWAGDAAPDVQRYVAEAQRRAFELSESGVDADELQPPMSERLDSVTAPALVVVGDGDVEDFRAIARHLTDTLPNAELRIVEDTGHLVALENPAVTAEVLTAWLGER